LFSTVSFQGKNHCFCLVVRLPTCFIDVILVHLSFLSM
jgi:hypothetical protein